MRRLQPARTKLWKPRFTIGNAMICIALIAVVLAALPLFADAMGSAYPALSQVIHQFATFENGAVLSCLVLGAYATIKLMEQDEK